MLFRFQAVRDKPDICGSLAAIAVIRELVSIPIVTILMAYGLGSMHLVAMKIVGTVFRVDGTLWDYHNNLQPLALGVGGFATCEVVLPDPKGLITTMPQPAELHFFRVVQLEDGVGEIDLYDGPKLIMKFRPLTLAELQAVKATA